MPLSRWILASLFEFTLLVGLAAPVRAEIPPLPDGELEQRSDVVVDARSVGIACEGTEPFEQGAGILSNYVATVEVTKVLKGSPETSLRVRGSAIRWVGEQPVGGSPVPPLPTGWQGRLYLVRSPDGTYSGTHFAYSVLENTASSRPAALTSCEGSSAEVDSSAGGCSAAGTRGTAGVPIALVLGSVAAAMARRRRNASPRTGS